MVILLTSLIFYIISISLKRRGYEKSAKVCQELCQNNNQCNYWTWLRKPRGNTKCRLKSGILSSRFRREKLNAVSGTLLKDECKADLIVNPRFATK